MTIVAYLAICSIIGILAACFDFVNFSICTWFASPKRNTGFFKRTLLEIFSFVLALNATTAMLTLGKYTFCSLSNKEYGMLAFSLSLLPIFFRAIRSHANILNGKTPSKICVVHDQINQLEFLAESYINNPFYLKTSKILVGFHVFKNFGQIFAAIAFYKHVI
jgi:hypothetical protein